VHQSDDKSGGASVVDVPEAFREADGWEVTIKKKFGLALIAYAVLGVLAWTTLSDEPIRVFNANVKLRTGTLLILGLFAFRAALYFWRTRIEEERESVKPTD
jgi:hypothetical protein